MSTSSRSVTNLDVTIYEPITHITNTQIRKKYIWKFFTLYHHPISNWKATSYPGRKRYVNSSISVHFKGTITMGQVVGVEYEAAYLIMESIDSLSGIVFLPFYRGEMRPAKRLFSQVKFLISTKTGVYHLAELVLFICVIHPHGLSYRYYCSNVLSSQKFLL